MNMINGEPSINKPYMYRGKPCKMLEFKGSNMVRIIWYHIELGKGRKKNTVTTKVGGVIWVNIMEIDEIEVRE